MGGAGVISGRFSTAEASELALLLRSGALPAPLLILEERRIGPSMGQDSIDAGVRAAWVGFVAVILFMVWIYGVLGVFASLALVVNIFLMLGIMTLLQATLTMPGIGLDVRNGGGCQCVDF
jgi:protein-export membrane protein SecD